MAQVQRVLLTCDICGGDKPGDETVDFRSDGAAYEVDLCDKHAKQLRDGLAPFTAAARRASTRGGGRPRSGSANRGRGDREQTAAIRAWAKSKGIKVSERGRLSAEVVAQYEAAAGR